MNKILLFTVSICIHSIGMSQETEETKSDTFLREISENGCKCVDSIPTYNRLKAEVSKDIIKCIDDQTNAYQLGSKLMNLEELKEKAEEKDGKKHIEISISSNESSEEYKKYYFDIERYMMNNCASLQEKVASNEEQRHKSMSDKEKAVDYFNKGITAAKSENFEKAEKYYEKAVKIDPEFAFAWDNLGITYRRLNKLEKAIEAYETSLTIDPNGVMPLQNIAIVYQYKKEYLKAISAYERLALLDANNPEVFYGIGQIYAMNLKDYEKGLPSLCKAYNIYSEQKSPYRTDAEKIISIIYSEMKKQGQEERFNQILKDFKISSN